MAETAKDVYKRQGETVFTMDVSNKYGYNNMAIGMYAGNSGNALYCPTGYLEPVSYTHLDVYKRQGW